MLLIGYDLSTEASRKIRNQIDANEVEEILKCKKHLGEPYRSWVIFCNKGGMLLFMIGVILLITFLTINVEAI